MLTVDIFWRIPGFSSLPSCPVCYSATCGRGIYLVVIYLVGARGGNCTGATPWLPRLTSLARRSPPSAGSVLIVYECLLIVGVALLLSALF